MFVDLKKLGEEYLADLEAEVGVVDAKLKDVVSQFAAYVSDRHPHGLVHDVPQNFEAPADQPAEDIPADNGSAEDTPPAQQ